MMDAFGLEIGCTKLEENGLFNYIFQRFAAKQNKCNTMWPFFSQDEMGND